MWAEYMQSTAVRSVTEHASHASSSCWAHWNHRCEAHCKACIAGQRLRSPMTAGHPEVPRRERQYEEGHSRWHCHHHLLLRQHWLHRLCRLWKRRTRKPHQRVCAVMAQLRDLQHRGLGLLPWMLTMGGTTSLTDAMCAGLVFISRTGW